MGAIQTSCDLTPAFTGSWLVVVLLKSSIGLLTESTTLTSLGRTSLPGQPPASPEVLDNEPACTVDGSTLVFVHCKDQGSRCFLTRKSIDSGQSLALYELSPVNRMSPSDPTLAPDGTKVLFRGKPDGKDPNDWATVLPITGGNLQKFKMSVSVGEVDAFTWALDGKSILCSRNVHGVGNIWSVPLDGKAARKLTA